VQAEHLPIQVWHSRLGFSRSDFLRSLEEVMADDFPALSYEIVEISFPFPFAKERPADTSGAGAP
jgi:hypothetical protein